MNTLWKDIEYIDTPANHLRYDLEGVVCQGLESGVSITFRAKTNQEHNALKVEFSVLSEAVMMKCLNEVAEWYDFTIQSISGSSFILTDIKNVSEKAS